METSRKLCPFSRRACSPRNAVGSCLRGAAAVLLVLVAAGCPTGSYRERMEQRIQELNRGMPGQDMLSDEAQLPGTPLFFRVPAQFQTALAPGGSEKAQRRVPPVTVPDLAGTWEAHVDHEGKRIPYYFYLAVVNRSKNRIDVARAIVQEAQGLWSGINPSWQDISDLTNRSWKRLRIDGDQDWIPLDAGGKELPVQAMPGVIEFDLREEENYWIVAVWRVPRSIESQVRIDGLIGPTLASLKIKK